MSLCKIIYKFLVRYKNRTLPSRSPLARRIFPDFKILRVYFEMKYCIGISRDNLESGTKGFFPVRFLIQPIKQGIQLLKNRQENHKEYVIF